MVWNVVVASVLLTLGGNYITRFWVTFGLVCLITATQAVKVVIGLFYMLYYKCKGPSIQKTPEKPERYSRMDKIIKQYEPSIRKDIKDHLNNIKN